MCIWRELRADPRAIMPLFDMKYIGKSTYLSRWLSRGAFGTCTDTNACDNLWGIRALAHFAEEILGLLAVTPGHC